MESCRQKFYFTIFSVNLTTIEIKLNTYEPCVAKKIIYCKKMTVVWKVDDLKVRHES